MEVGPRAPLSFEAGKRPRCSDIEFTVYAEGGQRRPQVRRLRSPTDTDPDTPMQVSGVTPRGIDLHVLANLVGKEVAMVGGQNNRCNAQFPQDAYTTPQIM